MGVIAKYDYWLKPENLIKVEGWAKDGLSNEQIAKNIGIATSTFHVWQNRFADFSDAIKKGKETVDREVENAMHKAATGYWVTEEKTFIEEVDGKRKQKIERHKKWIAPSVGAQVYWLKNRKPDVWNERNQPETVSQENKVVDLMELIQDGAK